MLDNGAQSLSVTVRQFAILFRAKIWTDFWTDIRRHYSNLVKLEQQLV